MIIYTTNKQLAAVLTGYSQRDGDAFTLYPLKAQELSQLAVVLTTTYAGQWSIRFDFQPTAGYEDLTAGVDGANWRAFMLAPGEYGADTDDLINFIENAYGQSVTNDNYKQVAQMFRLWYAANHPAAYVNPSTAQPAKYAELSLKEPPEARRQRNQRKTAAANARRKQAANRLGTDTIDRFTSAVLALSDEDAAKLRQCFEEVTRKP